MTDDLKTFKVILNTRETSKSLDIMTGYEKLKNLVNPSEDEIIPILEKYIGVKFSSSLLTSLSNIDERVIAWLEDSDYLSEDNDFNETILSCSKDALNIERPWLEFDEKLNVKDICPAQVILTTRRGSNSGTDRLKLLFNTNNKYKAIMKETLFINAFVSEMIEPDTLDTWDWQ